jgi:hypothetical protein
MTSVRRQGELRDARTLRFGLAALSERAVQLATAEQATDISETGFRVRGACQSIAGSFLPARQSLKGHAMLGTLPRECAASVVAAQFRPY